MTIVSVYSESSPRFDGVQLSGSNKERCIFGRRDVGIALSVKNTCMHPRSITKLTDDILKDEIN